ncbi:MAG: hypothetical protein AABX66_02395 [Nanoarchaeota archaeon]
MPNDELVYSLENARELASLVRVLFFSGTLEEAVREAEDWQIEKMVEGRVRVFIPANTDSLTPAKFEELLRAPTKYDLVSGRVIDGPAIYGRPDVAFLGKTKDDPRPHPGFLVYDTNAAVIVDYIGRDGKTLINRMAREQYCTTLREKLGFDVSWNESSLAE